tara:strand:- start:66 stop:245 length:180 start_codon:yes stop_codon:yes gene_type:complete
LQEVEEERPPLVVMVELEVSEVEETDGRVVHLQTQEQQQELTLEVEVEEMPHLVQVALV